MKKLLSTKYSASAFNIALLILRLGAGLLIMHHGYQKLLNYGTMQNSFVSFMGLGSSTSLALTIFAEFFCGLFIALGLFTRLAAIPLVINMSVALIKGHNLDVFGKGEPATLFLVAFVVILLLGAGRASIDSMISK